MIEKERFSREGTVDFTKNALAVDRNERFSHTSTVHMQWKSVVFKWFSY